MNNAGMRLGLAGCAGFIGLLLAVMMLFSGCVEDGGLKAKLGFAPVEVKDPGPPRFRDVWPPRAVWVVRQVYNSPDEIADLMEECKQLGLNTVLFQVRGNGTAFYRSSIEPFAYEYGQDPGFDPLKVACQEAHRRGLALHAWVNVMPAWRGEQRPNDPRQLYNARPEWFWYDQKGRRQPLGWYSNLNPCLPEVRRYLVSVFEEIVRYYPVDGLHLDYIRFPSEECPKGSDYPYDAKTLALYKKATGKRPQDNGASWSRWRVEQVTQLMRDIRRMMKTVRPEALLTAACGANIEGHRKHYFQDGPAWLRGNLIDLAFIMNYSKDTRTYRLRHEAWRRVSLGKPIAPGIGMYMHESNRTTVDQLKLARQWGGGVSLFSAESIFGKSNESRQRLAAIRPVVAVMRDEARARNMDN